MEIYMKKLIGKKEFYRTVAMLALPLLLQNAVSTFVNLLDNLMVGRLGTESMSGVSIVNQVLFVYNLCLFGGTGGAGIFGAQFFGRGDHGGADHCGGDGRGADRRGDQGCGDQGRGDQSRGADGRR